MRTLLLLVALGLFVGCKKRAPTSPAKDELPNVKLQQQSAATGDKDKKEDAPNWLKKPQDKKDQLPVDGPSSPNKQPWNVGPPQGGFTAPAPGVQPTPAPGTGVLQPNAVPAKPPMPTAPAFKPVEMADMKEVWVFIENASGASGRMPASALTYAALVEAKSPAAPLVKDGSIVLTGSTTRDSVWAFEARAYANGGLVASQNGVETLTAAQLQQRLKK